MKPLLALYALSAAVVLAGCSGTIPTTPQSTLTAGPFRCVAKDSFGDAFTWTNFHKEMAMTNAYDMCRYHSQAPDSCKSNVKDCVPISQVPDHLDSLSDFRGGQ